MYLPSSRAGAVYALAGVKLRRCEGQSCVVVPLFLGDLGSEVSPLCMC